MMGNDEKSTLGPQETRILTERRGPFGFWRRPSGGATRPNPKGFTLEGFFRGVYGVVRKMDGIVAEFKSLR